MGTRALTTATGDRKLDVVLPARPVWLLAFPGVQALDVTGPHEVLSAANRVLDEQRRAGPRYDLRVVGPVPQVRTESGLTLAVEPLPDPVPAPHTLLLPGGDGVHRAAADTALVAWVAAAGAAADRLACVCTGALLAAAAGLLDGHRVTTHWARARLLSERHPEVDVDAEPLWLADGRVWSSAGVTAGMDLALAVVEHDHGPDVARTTARWLVLFLRRPGGQSQFVAPAWSAPATRAPVRRAQDLVHRDPAADLSLAALAAAVGLSPRHLARLFRVEVGQSPARYVEEVRVAAARHHLETTALGLDVIAARCGFGTAETLRRTFARRLGVPPDQYRRRFRLVPA